jgi:hypothetical protein
MAVYVDNMRKRARVKHIMGVWCHLTADTTEELHEFAAGLGLRREWFQPASVYPDTAEVRLREAGTGRPLVGTPRPGARDHYDVTEKKRKLAVRMGAAEVRIGHEPWRGRRRREAAA